MKQCHQLNWQKLMVDKYHHLCVQVNKSPVCSRAIKGDKMSIANKVELYDYQKELINEVRKVWKHHNRIMIQLATAGGKTFTIASMIDKMADSGMRCVFLVPRITLIQQAIDEFIAYGIDFRRISKICLRYGRTPIREAHRAVCNAVQ